MKWHLYFLMGVSWAGKWTMRHMMKERRISVEFLKSYVTRDIRPWEINGDGYWFITKEEFEDWIEKNDFLEYEINHKTAFYGTKKSEVIQWLSDWKTMMKEIDIKWIIQLKSRHPNFQDYTSIFLDIPNKELKKRFYERTPDGTLRDLQNRIESTELERVEARQYCDHIIDATQEREVVLEEILKIMKK